MRPAISRPAVTAPGSALVVEIAGLRRRTGATIEVSRTAVIAELEITTARVRDDRIDVDLVVENVLEGLVAHGRVRAVADAECRRCLDPVTREIDITVREVYELHPTEGETWPIEDDHIDLEPMVRESVMLALPLAPLCGDDCRGPEPDRFPAHAPDGEVGDEERVDPRWAALDQLEFDE